MPGGPRDAYARVQSLLESGAAQVNGEACVAYLGPGSAGHFVKMVHNGIEYAAMQLIAETYDIMKRGLGLSDDELHEFYAGWNRGESEGYLLEITAKIFSKMDGKTGRRLIDEVKGVAQQLGTGRWTSQTALHLGTPSPTIDIAVAMRSLSELGDERKVASKLLLRPVPPFPGDSDKFLQQLSRALSAATQIAYAQGFAVLRSGSDEQGYNLDLATIARIWRGGCIIRTALLEHMREAFQAQPALRNLLADPGLAKRMMAHQEDLRIAVIKATQLGLPVPGLMSALSYLDAYRSEWVPANLIQAQRDYFGAHTYERTDLAGTFHTAWAAAETS